MKLLNYFTRYERFLWVCSVFIIISSFIYFDTRNYFILAASLIGITSLIFCAKGNAIGQLLMIIFSLLYGYISYTFHYYGEMLTYLGMTLPMAVLSLITWVKNPYGDSSNEVKIETLRRKEIRFMMFLTIIVTLIFYFVLKFFDTANLFFSTISIATSFIAVYLTYKRSSVYALAYAANDLVLIILWYLASLDNSVYSSVVICFCIFFINDVYGYVNWKKMKLLQSI